jgi:hypothetical protein
MPEWLLDAKLGISDEFFAYMMFVALICTRIIES